MCCWLTYRKGGCLDPSGVPVSKAKQRTRLVYYSAMAAHLRYVLERQRERCPNSQDVNEAQMNLDFYAITARRVRELLKQGSHRGAC